MAVTARLLGEHMDASVVAYADMEVDQDAFTIRGDWSAQGAQSIVGSYSLDSFGGTAARAMRSGAPLVIRDVRGELGAEEGNASSSTSASRRRSACRMSAPGNLAAMMAVHQNVPRDWTEDEQALVAEATERSWAHIVRVRSEAILRESEDRFRNIADHTPVMLWVTDETGYCTYLNRTWYEFTGQTEHEGEGFGWLNAVHDDDRPEAERAFRRRQRSAEGLRGRLSGFAVPMAATAGASTPPRRASTGRAISWAMSARSSMSTSGAKAWNGSAAARSNCARSSTRCRSAWRSPATGSGEVFIYNQALEELLGHPSLPNESQTYDRYGGIDSDGSVARAEGLSALSRGRAWRIGHRLRDELSASGRARDHACLPRPRRSSTTTARRTSPSSRCRTSPVASGPRRISSC